MKNVYDIKKEKSLNYILPMQAEVSEVKSSVKVAVIVHLHYWETLEVCLRYIKQIPKEIDIFVTCADDKVRNAIEKSDIICRKNFFVVEKKNRGRDISSFLVACRKEIMKYDYIGFVHDKKEKSKIYQKDTREWFRCLWENMIGSQEYINNILAIFRQDHQLGLLVPPPPVNESAPFFYSNAWRENFELTEALARRMELNCDLNSAKSPITLGTTFWARVSALKKLIEIDWKYEDFDEEPLKDDGTISHAIERILAYVVQDAGYETGWVMTDQYAGECFEKLQTILAMAFDRLRVSLGIRNFGELKYYECLKVKLLEFVNKYEHFYIYGAGSIGKCCFTMLKSEQKTPDAFVVSNISGNPMNIQGVPVYEISQIDLNACCGIIVAVNGKYQEEVLQMMKNKKTGFTNIYLYNSGLQLLKLIDQ